MHAEVADLTPFADKFKIAGNNHQLLVKLLEG